MKIIQHQAMSSEERATIQPIARSYTNDQSVSSDEGRRSSVSNYSNYVKLVNRGYVNVLVKRG